jgi:hypothetical protein
MLVVATAAAAAPPAYAKAPQRTCDLVTDARGDASVVPGVSDPSDLSTGALDIVSADIASNARYVTAAIRLADLARPAPLAAVSSSSSGEARSYSLHFDTEGLTWSFTAALDAAGPPAALHGTAEIGRSLGGSDAFGNGWGSGFSADAAVPARVVVDAPHDEVRITITRQQVKQLGKLPSRIGPLVVVSYRDDHTGPAYTGYQYDYARGSRSYRLDQPSCVPTGR